MKIMIVEDEAALADVIARNLRARGHEVIVCGAAEDALSRLSEGPDILVLDINLPDITGWELLRRLDEEQRTRLRVIVISAAPISPRRIEEFRPAGCLQKPFPIDALVRALNELSSQEEGGLETQ